MEFHDARRDVEVTGYHYSCTSDDISATVADELVLPRNATPDSQAVERMQTHGAAILPDILSPATAQTLRQFIVAENTRQEGFYVLAGDHRYSFGLQVDQHPSLAVALEEIAHHATLQTLLTKLVGRNPAVMEFTAITSEYGATAQAFHQDVVPEGSAAKYARSFVPSYSLFIPLQDTTAAMGATVEE